MGVSAAPRPSSNLVERTSGKQSDKYPSAHGTHIHEITMTLDQLTELAARVTDTSIPIYAFTLDELAALAEAIAAEEREACAKVCEEMTAAWTEWQYNGACIDCANAIRARDTA